MGSSLRWLLTDKGSCCHAERVGRRVGSSSTCKSQRPPKASPESGQATCNSSLAQRACRSGRKPKGARKTQRERGKPPSAHPAAKGGLMHIQGGPTPSFPISRVEKPWPGWGDLYFTLRCTQLGSDWHPVLICKKGSICIHQDSRRSLEGLAPS